MATVTVNVISKADGRSLVGYNGKDCWIPTTRLTPAGLGKAVVDTEHLSFHVPQKREYVRGTKHLRFKGLEIDPIVVVWALAHLTKITAKCTSKYLQKFAANLREANGQELTMLTDGFGFVDDRCWGYAIGMDFDMDVPAEFNTMISDAQNRQGTRAFEERTDKHPRAIFCNALAWELLRAGKKLGKQ